MDVFKIEQSLSAGLGSAPAPDTLTPDVSFGASADPFTLSFFDGTDSSAHDFSDDPGSVGSASASPPPHPGTPGTLPLNPASTANSTLQHQQQQQQTTVVQHVTSPGIVVKQGLFFWFVFVSF
ncbi:hypothetical protein QAD02_004340 [Eretmocerus hayati]|uniref:Uncharacterized protein n=1 Tax=Eretmocerus hayati TaxID=131215 RepID=A0ACC2NPR5_9HYME|nr:hypothetical protein QAD02_004340 [Eretmocerus hayati]